VVVDENEGKVKGGIGEKGSDGVSDGAVGAFNETVLLSSVGKGGGVDNILLLHVVLEGAGYVFRSVFRHEGGRREEAQDWRQHARAFTAGVCLGLHRLTVDPCGGVISEDKMDAASERFVLEGTKTA
jgi:hypothetical protein